MTQPAPRPAPYEPPMAFFSYAWTTEAHKARVLTLVNRLRHDGVNALIDQVSLQPGEDTIQFMERIATDPKLKKVVAVCDRNYAEKVDARRGGSGTEGTIMSPEVYRQIGEGLNKYVAVAFEVGEHGGAYVPTMFATRLYIDMSTDDLLEQNYLRLLRFLHDRPEPEVPVGKPPAVLFETHPASAAALAKGMLVRSAVERHRGVTTPWMEFVETVVDPLRAFTAPINDRRWDVKDALEQLESTMRARDALVDTVRFLSREGALRGTMLIELFQTLGNLTQAQARAWGVQTEATAHTRLAIMELVLHVVAVLIQEGRPNLLQELLMSDYLQEYHGEQKLADFGFLQQDVQWFDDTYNAAFNTRWISPAGEWLNERATQATVTWPDLLQADALLHLQTQVRRLTAKGLGYHWWGPTSGYWGHHGKFPLFLRFTSRAFLKEWLPVFGVQSTEDFRAALDARSIAARPDMVDAELRPPLLRTRRSPAVGQGLGPEAPATESARLGGRRVTARDEVTRVVSMAYALRADGHLARADTETKVQGTEFRCLDCGERVKLRRGEVRAPHFSHLSDSSCTGEGVLHHAAKLELARALRERERPLQLRVPCHWPGCQAHQVVDLDHLLGAFTTVVTEHTLSFQDGSWVRFDVAVLLHDVFEAGFEVYHHHRVPEEKRRRAMPNWLEIYAEPLLDDPYVLTLLKDDPPLDPQMEEALDDPAALQDVSAESLEAVTRYRGRGAGQWIHELREDDVHIDDFSWYACDQHLGQYDRLIEAALSRLPRPEVPPPAVAVALPETFTDALERIGSAARFAVQYYARRGVPLGFLAELSLKACRCPHCDERVVVIKDDFVLRYWQFQNLLSTYQQKMMNRCGHCRQVINRRVFSDAAGIHLPGDVVAAWDP